jgi:hypothetical protein
MWWVHFLHFDPPPFFSNKIPLWLSWYTTLSVTWYPWASRKYFVHKTWGMMSSTAMSLAYVELLVFSFWQVDVGSCISTWPLHQVKAFHLCGGVHCKCTICPPMYHAITIILEDQWKILCWTQILHHSSKILVIILISILDSCAKRNATAVRRSGLACLLRNRSFVTLQWNHSFLSGSSFSASWLT